MSTMPSMPPDGTSTSKKFWSRPEGKMAIAVNIAIGAVILYFWGAIVPFVLAAAVDTFHLIVVAIAIAAIVYVLFDSNFRRFLWFLYRAGMRALTSAFVDLDPIGILKTLLEKAKSKKEDLEEAISDIRGQRLKLERALASNQKDYDDSMFKLQGAKKIKATSKDELQLRQADRIEGLESKQIGRLDGLLTQQREHMKRYDLVVNILTRYNEVCDDTIIDMDRDIKFRQQEQEQSTAFQRAMRGAFGILKGNPEDLEMQDMAVEALERDYTQRLGEVENILDITKNVIVKADFNDSAAMEKATQLLDNWKHKSSGVDLGKGASKDSVVADAEKAVGNDPDQVSRSKYF